MYCLGKQVDGRFYTGTITIKDYLKSASIIEREITDESTPMVALWFTSDPYTYDPDNASFYVEGTPGMTEFRSRVGGKTVNIPRTNVVDISTFSGDFVKCPEDCTGLFANMSLGYRPNSYHHYERWKRWKREDEYSSWVLAFDDTYSGDNYKDKTIDFSGFDFSETKNMTSLFENCLATSGAKTSIQIKNYVYTMVSPPGKYLGRDYDYDVLDYMPDKVMFKGLAGGDTSNVENISRMFANIQWNQHSKTAYTGPFNIDGVYTFDFPKVTNASNLFANSNISLEDVVFNIGGTTIDLSYAFSNYKYIKDSVIDISDGGITSDDGNLSSMFRNTNVKTIFIGSTLNDIVSKLTSATSLNYMFCFDNATSNLEAITVKAPSDWQEMNSNLDGYKMFLNCNKLPNYINGETNIEHANNTRATGYFGMMPPEKAFMSYIKKRYQGSDQGLESTVYFKDSEGTGKEAEVYI